MGLTTNTAARIVTLAGGLTFAPTGDWKALTAQNAVHPLAIRDEGDVVIAANADWTYGASDVVSAAATEDRALVACADSMLAFAAIVHGANGLSWYTYTGFNKFQNVGVTSNPAKWSFLKGLAREISGYSEVLLQDNRGNPPAEILSGPAVDAFGAPSVTALLKRKGSDAWLFAVNAVKANVKVRFRLEHANGNIIEDEFDPFGVRIYRLKINE